MMARAIVLLGVTTLSLCCVGAHRKLTQSAAAPAPAGPNMVQDLLDVLGRNQSIGTEVEEPRQLICHTLTEQDFCVFQVRSFTKQRKLLCTQAWCTQMIPAPCLWVRVAE